MLCYINHPWKEAGSHWLLKEKPYIAKGESNREKITLPGWLSSPGKKQREAQPTYSCLASLRGSLQPPRIRSSGLSPAAQCCCGIGNLLWLRKIMGICFSKPKKSQTKFRREREKKSTKTADLTGGALGICLHMPQFSLVFPGSVIRKIIILCLLLLFFSGLLVVVQGGQTLWEFWGVAR